MHKQHLQYFIDLGAGILNDAKSKETKDTNVALQAAKQENKINALLTMTMVLW